MQTQPFYQDYPNTIPITKVRRDIDSLVDLLHKYSSVNVLKGQNILFRAIRPDNRESQRQKKLAAARTIRQLSQDYPASKPTLTEILIKERDLMRSGRYE